MSFLRIASFEPRQHRTLVRVGWAGAGVACAAAAVWGALALGPRKTVEAAPPVASYDTDGDGLPDDLEIVIGSAWDRTDTDGDGYSDTEEVARKSKPHRKQSVPQVPGSSMSMDAYQLGPMIHSITVIYLPDGVLAGKKIAFGTARGNELFPVPQVWLSGGHGMVVKPASDGVGALVILDPMFHQHAVFGRRGLSLYATVAQAGNYLCADALNLAVVDAQIFEQVILSHHGPTAISFDELAVGLGVGGVYRPLIGDQGDPSLGEICAQTTVVVGVINGIVTQEVAAADCVSGWNAFCAPGCAATVGSQIKTIDPAALIGN